MKKYLSFVIFTFLFSAFVLVGCDLGNNSPSNGSKPSAPYLTGSYTATQTFLSWDAIPGAEEYVVYISTSENPNSLQRIATVTGTSYTHNTTLPYNYTVRAWNSNGYSPFSNYVNSY
jgi:hypothetical protein